MEGNSIIGCQAECFRVPSRIEIERRRAQKCVRCDGKVLPKKEELVEAKQAQYAPRKTDLQFPAWDFWKICRNFSENPVLWGRSRIPGWGNHGATCGGKSASRRIGASHIGPRFHFLKLPASAFWPKDKLPVAHPCIFPIKAHTQVCDKLACRTNNPLPAIPRKHVFAAECGTCRSPHLCGTW